MPVKIPITILLQYKPSKMFQTMHYNEAQAQLKGHYLHDLRNRHVSSGIPGAYIIVWLTSKEIKRILEENNDSIRTMSQTRHLFNPRGTWRSDVKVIWALALSSHISHTAPRELTLENSNFLTNKTSFDTNIHNYDCINRNIGHVIAKLRPNYCRKLKVKNNS